MTAPRERDAIQAWLVERVCALRGVPASEVSADDKLETLGLDSMATVELTGELEGWLGRRLSPTLLFEFETIAEIAQHLAQAPSPEAEAADPIFDALTRSAEEGLAFLTVGDESLDGRTLMIGGKRRVTFASCSYIGIDLDPRLREGALRAMERYGAQFSYSRAYASIPLYEELEAELEQLFGAPVQLAQTTTLAHQAVLPLAVTPRDAVVLDHQVHHSVRVAVAQLARSGSVQTIPHNALSQLDSIIASLRTTHERIWYMADGVYSMFGDPMPAAGMMDLLERHPQLHIYIDDAHGMSWIGKHGRGYALTHLPLHPRTILATSLDKAFAAVGGVLVIPDPALRRRVRLAGGPLVFSGPINPPMLGIALASAKIHLSDEIRARQEALRARVEHTNAGLAKRNLPVAAPSVTPIRFVAVGKTSATEKVLKRLMNDGLLVNGTMFPAVPMGRSGIRFCLTPHLEIEDIDRLLDALAHHLPQVLEEEGTSIDEVRETFGAALLGEPGAT